MNKNHTDLTKTRPQWRAALIAQRLAMREEDRILATQTISTTLSAVIQQRAASVKTIGAYIPHRGEVDLRGWMAIVDFQQAAALALPVVLEPAMPLRFARFRIGDTLVKGAHGIDIPDKQEWVIPDVLLVPCVGFTRNRLRLGYGGGYYDRTLASMRPKPLTLGIAFACQECSMIAQEHDAVMDAIITEKFVL